MLSISSPSLFGAFQSAPPKNTKPSTISSTPPIQADRFERTSPPPATHLRSGNATLLKVEALVERGFDAFEARNLLRQLVRLQALPNVERHTIIIEHLIRMPLDKATEIVNSAQKLGLTMNECMRALIFPENYVKPILPQTADDLLKQVENQLENQREKQLGDSVKAYKQSITIEEYQVTLSTLVPFIEVQLTQTPVSEDPISQLIAVQLLQSPSYDEILAASLAARIKTLSKTKE